MPSEPPLPDLYVFHKGAFDDELSAVGSWNLVWPMPTPPELC
jgi:hypothetical protein